MTNTSNPATARTSGLPWLTAWWAATSLLMFAAIWSVFVFAPEEKVMGASQKIFYFHVPAAMVTYASVALLLGGSLGYLFTRDRRWDNLARASTEVGLFFCTLVLITGPIWAKPAWGTWWTWEARLTTTLILWLLMVACLLVRDYAENRDLGARLASIVGIVAALDVPIIHKAVQWWRGQHPQVFKPGEGGGLHPDMRTAFLICTIAFFMLFGLLVAIRDRMAALEDRADAVAERATAEGD